MIKKPIRFGIIRCALIATATFCFGIAWGHYAGETYGTAKTVAAFERGRISVTNIPLPILDNAKECTDMKHLMAEVQYQQLRQADRELSILKVKK